MAEAFPDETPPRLQRRAARQRRMLGEAPLPPVRGRVYRRSALVPALRQPARVWNWVMQHQIKTGLLCFGVATVVGVLLGLWYAHETRVTLPTPVVVVPAPAVPAPHPPEVSLDDENCPRMELLSTVITVVSMLLGVASLMGFLASGLGHPFLSPSFFLKAAVFSGAVAMAGVLGPFLAGPCP